MYTKIIPLGRSSIILNVNMSVIDTIICTKREVTAVKFKFVALDNSADSISLIAVI